MFDPDDRDGEWSENGDSLSDFDWPEDRELDFDWEPDEPEPKRFVAWLLGELERLLALVPGTAAFWARVEEAASQSVEWRLEEFEGLTALSDGEKQALLPRIRAIEERLCTLKAAQEELPDKITFPLGGLLMVIISLLAPLLANAWWAGGEYPLLTWVLLCGATLIGGSILGFGVLFSGIGLLSLAPRPLRKLLKKTTAALIVPVVCLPGLAILAFWMARAALPLKAGQPDAWGLLRAALPVAGMGAGLVFVGSIVLMTVGHFVYLGRMARRDTRYVIPHALMSILQEIEGWQDGGESANIRRGLADALEGVADLVSRRLPPHLVCGDPGIHAWVRTITAEMANHLRWLKTGLLLPVPDWRRRITQEVAEMLVHTANGHWGSLTRRPLERPLWRLALSRGLGRLAVYLKGLAWALAPPLGLWALQRTSYALSGRAADLVTVGALLWAAILLLGVLDRLYSFSLHELPGLEAPPWWRPDRDLEVEWGGDEMAAGDGETVFVTLVGSPEQRAKAELLIDSLRTFGGAMRDCPVWLFEADPEGVPCAGLAGNGVEVHPLEVPESLRGNWFAGKVCACARAEEMAGPEVDSLVWVAPDCLILQPPVLLDLGWDCDAAVRPVHHKNVGLRADEPLDPFWQGVYQAVGLPDTGMTVESFVEGERLRAYFNSHLLAVSPDRRLFQSWLQLFEALMADSEFQKGPCQDEGHQVFLHQAALSALLAVELSPGSLRILPPQYSYPYNLHGEVPAGRNAKALDDLVCIAYEDRPLHPDQVDDIEIREPLRSWLLVRTERLRAEG